MNVVESSHQKLENSSGATLNAPGLASRHHRFLIAFLGFAAGATVANIYYSQPLLHAISTHFHSDAAATSIVSVATQLGFSLFPLGQRIYRRTSRVAGGLPVRCRSNASPRNFGGDYPSAAKARATSAVL